MLKVTSDNSSIRTIAVIGSGLAGLTSAIILGQLGHNVRVFEKSRGPGGRMSSKRVAGSSADMGAQYFTVRHPEFLTFLSQQAGEDTFGAWPARFGFQDADNHWQAFPDENRYVGIPRMTAITRALSARVDVAAEVRITRLVPQGGQWQLECAEGHNRGVFDQVIITAPPAQAQDILAASGLDDLAATLTRPVEHILPCWTVAAHFAQPPTDRFDAMRPNSERLYWVANNSSKPGRNDAGQWWVLQATPAWTTANVDASADDVCAQLLSEFSKLTGNDTEPTETVAHRWLYARSADGDKPGYVLDQQRGIGLAGDWLAGGRVEGAWESATRLVSAMQ
ncbi:MAG: FAD-dependent oxidoreductase [Marinobacter sp.]